HQLAVTRCRGKDSEVAVSECAVRKTVTEWKQRLDVAFIEITVAHIDAFAARAIPGILRDRKGQFARWIDIAEYHGCNRVAAVLTREPGSQQDGDLIDPLFRMEGRARVQNRNRILV